MLQQTLPYMEHGREDLDLPGHSLPACLPPNGLAVDWHVGQLSELCPTS